MPSLQSLSDRCFDIASSTSFAVGRHRDWYGLGAFNRQLDFVLERERSFRFGMFNAMRRINCAENKLNSYQLLVAAIAQQDVPRVGALLRQALSEGMSANAILVRFGEAVGKAYRVKGFSMDDGAVMRIVQLLGGRRCSYLVAEYCGLPKQSTARALWNRPALRAAWSESDNISSFDHNVTVQFADASFQLRVAAIDEIHCREAVAPDLVQDCATGVCEHYRRSIKALTYADLLKLRDDLKSPLSDVHYAKYCTVIAIGALDTLDADITAKQEPMRAVYFHGTCGKGRSATAELLRNRLLIQHYNGKFAKTNGSCSTCCYWQK